MGYDTLHHDISLDGHLPDRPEQLRAIVADDDPFARRMIREVLQRADIIVVAEAHNGREAVELCLHYRPDIVLMDVVMPELDGIVATRRIIKQMPDQLIVILTSSDEQDIGMLGLRAGAVGFLSKQFEIEMLPQALRGAVEGEAVISRRLGAPADRAHRRQPEGAVGLRPVKSPLTPREWEVIDLLVRGQDDRPDRRVARPLVRDRALAREEHPAQAARELARRGASPIAQRMRGA